MIIAQLSDPHVDVEGTEFHNLYRTADKLRVALDKAANFIPKPDAIVITGDLVNCGDAPSYAILKNIIERTEIPVYLGVGNHDCRDTLRSAFPDHSYIPKSGFIQYAWKMNGHKMIMLDTNIPGEPGGVLCKQRLEWLDKSLKEDPETPTVIFMHHPPFKTGIKAMDDMGLADAHEFGEILEKYDQVTRIFCGHLHRSILSNFHGVQAQICPSTTHNIVLHLEKSSRLATTSEPSEFLLHIWNDEGDIVTHNCFTEPSPILWERE